MNLPEWYIEGVPRVSKVVWFKYPFKGWEWFERWLESKWIEKEEYMYYANLWWTYIHKILEDYLLGNKLDLSLYKAHKLEIDYAKEYIDNLKSEFPDTQWFPEAIVLDKKKRFQWTADLVRINWNKVFLYDYKTYEIVKKKYNMETKLKKDWTPYKPSDNLKKVALQLSLYAQYYIQQWYEIWGIYLVWIHSSWVHEYELELWNTGDINKLLIDYYNSLYPKEINMDLPFEIEILEPTKQYWNIKLRLDLSTVENWKTPKENIDELIAQAKYIAGQMKD